VTACGVRQFAVNDRMVIKFTISEADQRQFADVSGDLNPLHLNYEFAERMGFGGLVVYGGLLIAKLSQIIGLHMPGPIGLWSNLRIDFLRPLLVGEMAQLIATVVQVSEASNSIVIGFTITSGAGVIAKGRALTTIIDQKLT